MEFEIMANLCKFVNAEFELTKELINSILQSLTKIEEAANIQKNSYDFCAKVITALENIHYDAYKYNVQLSIHTDWFNLLNRHDISYIQADISQYKENHESTCVVVNASNDSDIIHIYDIGNTKNYDIFFSFLYTNFKNNSYERTTILPSVDKVFGIVINNCFYRAVRNNLVEADQFRALLIDHGSIVRISISSNFYLLSSDIQSVPSMAIPCKVIDNETINEFLESCIHEKYAFVVKKKHQDLIEISLNSLEKNPFVKQELCENEKKWFSFNYIEENKNFNYDECNEISKPTKYLNGESIFNENSNRSHIRNTSNLCVESKEYLFKYTSYEHDYDYSEKLFQFTGNNESVLNKNFGQEELPLRMLNNLALESQQTEYDQVMRKFPSIGANIFIVPTHLLNVTTFYGQVIDHETSLTSLSQLQSKLNDPYQVSKYTKFTSENLPQKLDFVIARFSDGLFYRAQIMKINYDEFNVFYLDYGNDWDLPYFDMRKWEKQFENLAFQAVKFQLTSIKPKIHPRNNEDMAIEAEQFLDQNFLNRKFLAKIISSKEDLITVAVSSPNFKSPTNDLSDLLVMKNFAIYDSNA